METRDLASLILEMNIDELKEILDKLIDENEDAYDVFQQIIEDE